MRSRLRGCWAAPNSQDLEADPAFRTELDTLVEEIETKGGDQIIQSAKHHRG